MFLRARRWPVGASAFHIQPAKQTLRMSTFVLQAAKCKWRALRHTCLLLLSILGGMPASHQGMQARLFFVVDI